MARNSTPNSPPRAHRTMASSTRTGHSCPSERNNDTFSWSPGCSALSDLAMQPVKERSSISPSPSTSSLPEERQPATDRYSTGLSRFLHFLQCLLHFTWTTQQCRIRCLQGLTVRILRRMRENCAADSFRPPRATQTPIQNTVPWPNAPGLNRRSSGTSSPGRRIINDMASPTCTPASLSTLHPLMERLMTDPSPSASPLNVIERAKRENERRQVGGTPRRWCCRNSMRLSDTCLDCFMTERAMRPCLAFSYEEYNPRRRCRRTLPDISSDGRLQKPGHAEANDRRSTANAACYRR